MKITDVSKHSGLSADTLRYYERIGLIPAITRDHNGIREYSETDLPRVEFIKCMRSAGLSIDLLVTYFKLIEQGDTTVQDRKEILVQQRDLLISKMHELQQTIDLLNHKIKRYESAILQKEQAIL